MSTELENKVDRLATALERMLDQGSFSGGRTGGTGSGAGAGSADTLQSWNTGLGNVISSTGKLARGQGDLLGVIDDVGKVFTALGPVGGLLTTVFKGVTNEVISMNNNLMDSTRYGINFGQDLGKFTAELGKAGIGQEQWTKLLQTNSKYISGTGATAQESANNFIKASQKLMETPEVIMARLSGIDFSEFQDQLLINTDLLKFNNMNEERTKQILKDSTVAVTIELDNMARITGKSRQEIQKGLDQTMKSNTVQLMKMSMDAEQLVAYEKTAITVDQYGKGIATLYADLTANRGDIVDAESNAVIAGLESFAPEAARALREASVEQNAERKEQLIKEFEFRMAEAASNKKNMEELIKFAKSPDPAMRSLVEGIVAAQPKMAADIAAIRSSPGGANLAGFEDQRRLQLLENMRQREATLDGSRPENTMSVTVNAAKDGVKTLSAGLAMGLQGMMDSANQEIRKLGIDYRNAYNIGAITPEELEAKLKKVVGWSGENTNDKTNAPKGTEFKWNKDNPPLPVTIVDPTKRELGSKGATGSWFEDGPKNILMGEKEPESVVPMSQISDFINDMVAKNPNVLSGLQGRLRNALTETNPAINIQRAIEQMTSSINIPSTISSSSTAGVTGAAIGSITESKTTSDLHAVLEKLNTKMDTLITAVEDGSNANVNAVKRKGNLIA